MGHEAGARRRTRLDRDEWSRFWERGTLTTFEGHFGDNYDAEIRDFWWTEFARLADGAVIIDLATGNGALALLAARHGREHGRGYRITGVDHAAIDKERVRAARPELGADLDGVQLLGNTPLEATGLPDGGADLVISQFGYEYGDTAAGSREAARLLRAGGRVAMILHHQGSGILSQAREGLRQVELCIEREPFLSLARRLAKLLPGLKAGPGNRGLQWSPGALKVREELFAVAARLETYARRPEVRAEDAGFIEFMLPSVMRLVEQARALDPQQLEAAWAALAAEAETYRLRMSDLVFAALDEAAMARVQVELAAAGFANITAAPMQYRRSTLLGWSLTADKS
jgi:SAM-dependent methyltransferase